jgi:hypothetical protein
MSCPSDQSRDSGCIPLWSNSTWIYKDYPGAATDALNKQYDETAWLNLVATAINSYNSKQTNPTSQITQIYPYASDLELPWVSQSYAGNGTPGEPLFSSPPINPAQATDCITNQDCFNQVVPPATYWDLSDPTKPCNQYGFFFVETNSNNSTNGTTSPVVPSQSGNTTAIPSTLTMLQKGNNQSLKNITENAIIIDGRIDNGYLQGLNEFLTQTEAVNLANLIVNGGYSQTQCKCFQDFSALCKCTSMNDTSCGGCFLASDKNTPATCAPSPAIITSQNWAVQTDKKQTTFQVGVGVFGPNSFNKYNPTINGIQLDLEPFDSTQPNQIAFYNQIATNLKATSQYWSIFAFPKGMTQITADLLNGTNISTSNPKPSGGNNGYMIVSLYDLVDMKNGIPAACDSDYTFTSGICDTSAAPPPVSATGDATTATYDPSVPHSALGYYNAALLTVKQTIAKAKLYGIKYKFAIPVSSSVHEFENWGQYICQFNDFVQIKPINAFCRMYNGLPLNPDSGNPSQINYLQQSLRAIYDGITQMNKLEEYDSTLFRGIDLYAFSSRTIWSPQNPVLDYDTGNVFYGNTSSYVPATDDGYTQGSLVNPAYVYTTPAYPDFGTKADGTADPNTILGWLSTVTLDVRPCGTNGGAYCPGGQTCTNGVCG